MPSEKYLRNKARALAYLGGQCYECGVTENLEFDHVIPELKVRNITSMLSYNWDDIEFELDKCQLLCKTHHEAKTYVDIHGHPKKVYTRVELDMDKLEDDYYASGMDGY